jgi:alkylation response protein AidB-like acyl-CoA dehydrogenase
MHFGTIAGMATTTLEETLRTLETHANDADSLSVWPAASWNAVKNSSVLRWCITGAYGGDEFSLPDLLRGYGRLAGACLTTSFILSQRDAACRRLRDGANQELRSQLLPRLARGEIFATVGLSQLTTSRQHIRPTLMARAERGSFILDGTIPWVTGAQAADYLVIGAVVEDGSQILGVLPRDLEGVGIGPPLDLMALQGSLTAEVRCRQVRWDCKWLLAGPAERVMTAGKGGTGGLETSCLAIGLADAAVRYIEDEARGRTELRLSAGRLAQTRDDLHAEMLRLAVAGCTPEAAAQLRARANSLVLRATQTALTAAKGTGFLRSHSAQRWARQALFFLVWSCPRPATEATLASLAGGEGPICS